MKNPSYENSLRKNLIENHFILSSSMKISKEKAQQIFEQEIFGE